MQRLKSFQEFWPYYIGEHSKPMTRTIHFVGTFLFFVCVGLAFFINLWWMALAPIAGYGFAWVSHFFIEKNKPATFQYPLWSLLADFRMFFLMCVGKMEREVTKYSVEPKD